MTPRPGLPAGFEPAFPPITDETSDPVETGGVSLPAVLLGKVELLRDRQEGAVRS